MHDKVVLSRWEKPRSSNRDLWSAVGLAAALAFAGVLWIQLLLASGAGHHDGSLGFVQHWLRDGTLAVLPTLAALLLLRWGMGRVGVRGRTGVEAAVTAVGAAGALALASPFHALLLGHDAGGTSAAALASHGVEVFVTLLPVSLLVTAVAHALRRRPGVETVVFTEPEARSRSFRPRLQGRAAAAGFTALAVLAPMVGGLGQAAPAAAQAAGVCAEATRTIRYDITAFETRIPLNGWGDHIPSGLMYALSSHKQDIIEEPGLSQPLVVRANVGDCIKITFRNDVNGRRVGMHADGTVQFDPKTSDGGHVGNNPDTTAAPGEVVEYEWYADRKGEAAIVDLANMNEEHGEAEPGGDDGGEGEDGDDDNGAADPDEGSTMSRGLYGAVVVHGQGSTWYNQETGENLLSNSNGRWEAQETQLFAAVSVPNGEDYRSITNIFLDENEGIRNAAGQPTTFPGTNFPDATFGLNYRSEPVRNRVQAVLDHRAGETVTLPNGTVIEPDDNFCDGWDAGNPDENLPGRMSIDPNAECTGEEMHLQSWPFGDEGKITDQRTGETLSDNLIAKAYVGDPVYMHVINPGAKETHPFHQHTQRWLTDPDNVNSPVKDVQTLGPGEAYVFKFDTGAGGPMGTIGDLIYHCHLYPHFAQGFWGHLRVFDKLRDESFGQEYPDGTPIETLVPLGDRAEPDEPTEDEPGFPLFVAGEYLQKAYRPPYAVTADPYAEHRRWGDSLRREPTDLEAANLPELDPEKPGAAYVDPCPADAPQRTYYPNAVDVPIEYNEAGWADPEGRVYLNVDPNGDEDIEDVVERVSADAQPDPFAIRAHQGDCVNVRTTNSLHIDDLDHDLNNRVVEDDEGNPVLRPPVDIGNDQDGVYMHEHVTTEVTTHVHLVQFDELGSDGTSVGWNYVQGPLTGQTYGYRWWVDLPLRTVFFHDHQFPNSFQQKGLYAAMHIEPVGTTWHDPVTGDELPGGVGPVADVRLVDDSYYVERKLPIPKSFREISVFYHDRSPMWRNGLDGEDRGNPINPPPNPFGPGFGVDNFGAEQGGVAVNYRNEPYQIRTMPGDTGNKGDPAYIHSSAVHGDPSTPVFRAYQGDPVVVRHMNGSHEEYHTFNLHGHRWLNQADNPDANWTDTQIGAIGEWFNYELDSAPVFRPPRRVGDPEAALEEHVLDASNGIPQVLEGAGAPGDYLYGSQNLDDQWLGMWGIFRVPDGRIPNLQPLPDRARPRAAGEWPALEPDETGLAEVTAPPAATNTCPAGSPQRSYDITAIQQKIVYNAETGDNDPHGLMYALTQDVAAIRDGTKATEPLMIRANIGDCLRITLRNALPEGGLPDHDDIRLWEDVPGWPKSDRVSLHAGVLDYDVLEADGATVGYNYDQTVAPGDSRTYYWHVPDKLEGVTIPMVDFGDRRGHRHHGLHGALLVQPRGAQWWDPKTGLPLRSGPQAVITWTDAAGKPQVRREWALDVQDGLSLRDPGGVLIPNAAVGFLDPHDSGTRGINYRTERFVPRLAEDPETANVFSSTVHGDPATPILEAYPGDDVRLRLSHSSDRGRVHVMVFSGHKFHEHSRDVSSNVVSSRPIMPVAGWSVDLLGGAGSVTRQSGDYLYRDGNLLNQTNQGLWGLMRVHAQAQDGLLPLSDFAPVANPPWAAPGAVPLMGDWNNDGIDTPGWYRNGRVWLRNSHRPGPPNITFTYGRAGDRPVVGDWNGDGTDTLGIVRGREWHLRNTNSAGPADRSFIYGRLTAGDYPLAGDWNNDTFDTVGIVRGGVWHLRNSNNAGPGQIVFRYGRVLQGDVPLAGDWTGDGTDTPGIVRGNEWHLRNSNTAGPANTVFRYGRAGDKPVPGAWSNNAADTPGIVRGLDWHLRNTNTAGAATISFDF